MSIPPDAVTFFRDDDGWCCVGQEDSIVGHGKTLFRAWRDYLKQVDAATTD